MSKVRQPRPSLANLLQACEHRRDVQRYATEIHPTPLLLTSVGGAERLAQLNSLYARARPRQSRWGPGFLTAEEVFRDKARKDGYCDEGVAMFIDQLDLWSGAS